ncbi:MAG: TraB/GumN family protein [Treponema sp.]|nr:TraB/GumN family protein [Treponema sp.]
MNRKFSARIFACAIFFSLIIFSACKSTKPSQQGQGSEAQRVTTLKKLDGAMLWQIDGWTDDGESSTVYLLGTYHAGDERITGFPECVQTALDNSDRFCCELSKKDWERFPDLVNELTMQSVLTDLSHTFVDDLTQDEIKLISNFIDNQTLAQLICFEPWVLNNYLQSVLILASGLDTTKAYDIMIMDELNKKGSDFDGLDEAQVQLDLTAWGDWNTQLIMLRDTLRDLMDLKTSVQEISDLYEIFLTGDAAAFEEAYYKDLEEEISLQPVYKEYIKELLADRNQIWAGKIQDYIKMGGTTFIFAGTAHFTGPDSVFEYLDF